ncbi:ImmA/IrrE family metallo-endopeptidase [Streptococcus sp. HSISS2]|uniref:ImmA/IrrE family metallo-endopeptidase n=1 Tax=Streptococcus sp. HSISS2 TaxID=1316411 RepID=UPI001F0AEC94
MPEKELLEQFNVSLCEFDSSQWPRDGFLDPVNRVVYINRDLSAERRLKVLLHELGHLEHNPKHYERLREKYEAQANRNMIHGLLKTKIWMILIMFTSWKNIISPRFVMRRLLKMNI